ncbi:hypothetical protein CO174_03355 [Candidatus Uhrbacteria bacterium CG_4_9_14_3_um_filter_50_9]|uniref:DUF3375 domain-containing protein n=1 Tax=Candidatus Uhrbacteria bacterium CG_4_9_14_3_um_filter_50_9 TaxID=1975035 RepID=A0A2M7XC18_9BACT|nr:MAG: hypothetical protein CO174_03355 [Candidatus Uhrbacteria bacterium CG_4_9_14_3_um_filter_50_9]
MRFGLQHSHPERRSGNPDSHKGKKHPKESLKEKDVFGTCDIEELWSTPQEMRDNVEGLPDSVQSILFEGGDPDSASDHDEMQGGFVIVHDLEQLRRLLKQNNEGTVQNTVERYISGDLETNVGLLGAAIGNYLSWHLKQFKQWSVRGKREDTSEDLQGEIDTLITTFWTDGQAPGLSLEEIQMRIEGYKNEIDRLQGEHRMHTQRFRALGTKLRETKQTHLKEKLLREIQELEKFLGDGTLFSTQGYLLDYQRRIEFNKDALKEHEQLAHEADVIEQVFAKLKPQMSEIEALSLWGSVSEFILEPQTRQMFEDAILAWLDEVGEIVPETTPLTINEKTQKLIEQFRSAYVLASDPDRSDPEANVRHTQFILRAILKRITRA